MEDTALDGMFWVCVRDVLQFTKPIYNMICFSNQDALVIGEVYEPMDNMLGQIKDMFREKIPTCMILFTNV